MNQQGLNKRFLDSPCKMLNTVHTTGQRWGQGPSPSKTSDEKKDSRGGCDYISSVYMKYNIKHLGLFKIRDIRYAAAHSGYEII